MDPLSITAAVIAIIQIADKIISTCKGYITTIKDAPRDLRSITIEVGSVKSVLELVELLLQGDGYDISDILEKLKGPNGPLEGCREALAALDSLFPRPECNPPGGKRRETLLTLKNLAWPFKESKARKILEDVGRYKAAISLTLTAESAQDIKTIKSRMVCLSAALSDAERESILRWLVVYDASELHNRACDLHEPETGKWLTYSSDYKEWINGSRSFLWLHGIPGSGKTVLASYIIEKAKEFCTKSASIDIACTYYYFWFKREKDETSQFLRWIINQLCRQSKHIPDEVRELYNGGGTPTAASLINALAAVLRRFQRVYLVIDALDESSNRSNLLDVLLQIHNNDCFKMMKILVTSRDEIDIGEVLRDISTGISLHNCWVDKDIRTYIQNHLRRDRKLNRWPEDIRREIETALVKGAKGMFRWAFCQLDILGRLKSAADVRGALDQLPFTIFETYDRIFASIPAENVKFACRALHLLAFDFSINTLGALAEAITFDDKTCAFIENDRFLSPKDILEICTCLITCDEDDDLDCSQVRLAHYSVQEYMTSWRMKGMTFGISEVEANVLAAKICLTYHLNLDSSDYEGMEQIYDVYDWSLSNWDVIQEYSEKRENARFQIEAEFPLAGMARNLDQFVKISGRDEVINDLVLRLYNPGRPYFGKWWELYTLFYNRATPSEVPRWKFPPGAELTASLAYLCWLDIHPAAEVLLERNPDLLILNTQLELENDYIETKHDLKLTLQEYSDGTPLHVALSLEREWFVEFLVAKGADVNVISRFGHTPLNLVVVRGIETRSCQKMMALLLNRKADPNPPCIAETPLQSAVFQRLSYKINPDDIEVIRMLLSAGADVNAIGNDEADIARILYWFRHDYYDDHERDEFIESRGDGFQYDSPLQMVENRLRERPGKRARVNLRTERKLLGDIKELLIKHGARAFHVSPDDYEGAEELWQGPREPRRNGSIGS